MSRSNYDKPFYVDVGTSIVAIRCASNRDVICEFDQGICPTIIKIAKDICDRMNREVEVSRPLRNCDVGTAEEQSDRYEDFCEAFHKESGTCDTCPIYKAEHGKVGNLPHCQIVWAQMPYEKTEEGD